MKVKPVLFLGLVFCLNTGLSFGQQATDYSSKVTTLDSTLQTLYEVISGAKGEKRNWDLFRYLFYENAKLIPTGADKSGVHRARFMSVEDYIQTSGVWLEENGFFENELHRVVESYGNISQVFSTYESFRTLTDTQPFMRGINSIQLLYDGKRWWILNIFWQSETEGNPIPPPYLPKN